MLVLSEISYINLLAQCQAYTRHLINMNFLSSYALKEVIIWLWKEHILGENFLKKTMQIQMASIIQLGKHCFFKIHFKI